MIGQSATRQSLSPVPPPPPVDRLNFAFTSRLPVILQNEVSECALACLAMVSAFYGHRSSLSELRRRFHIAITGSTVSSIATMAGELGLRARSLRLELDELGQLRRPAILHWRMDHYVVLRAVKRRGLVIHDPACGRRNVSWSMASRYFSGIAVELHPSRAFVPKATPERVRFRDLWSRTKGLGTSLGQMLLLSTILQVFALISPLVNQLVVDEAISKNDGDFLFALIVGFGLLLVLQTGVEALRGTVGMYFSQMLSFQLRSNLLQHLFRLPPSFFERRHVGDIVSRLGSLGPIQALISSVVITVLLDGTLAIATLVVMFLYSPTLAWLVVGINVLGFLTRLASFPYVRRLTEEKIYSDAELQNVLLESIRAMREVKLFGREAERHNFWQNAFIDSANLGIQLQKFGVAASAGSRLLFGALDLLVLYAGAMAVISGSLTLGMLFAFQSYRQQFGSRMAALINEYFGFRTVGIHLERLADIVHTDPELPGLGPTDANRVLSGGLELRGVRFRYGDDQPWILSDVDLKISPGERIGIVGSSGGGKTTLLKLLVGLDRPTEGDILYDGATMTDRLVPIVRRQIGVVMQDDQLLTGTLADNISFFDDTPDLERVRSAAETACIAQDIHAMPMGFQTLVGDMGSSLSGGQRQRVLLARALYKEPRILILDEGTANLDEKNESRILRNLESLAITQVVVAHRQAAIAACDRLIAISGGVATEIPPKLQDQR